MTLRPHVDGPGGHTTFEASPYNALGQTPHEEVRTVQEGESESSETIDQTLDALGRPVSRRILDVVSTVGPAPDVIDIITDYAYDCR